LNMSEASLNEKGKSEHVTFAFLDYVFVVSGQRSC